MSLLMAALPWRFSFSQRRAARLNGGALQRWRYTQILMLMRHTCANEGVTEVVRRQTAWKTDIDKGSPATAEKSEMEG